MLTVAYVGFGNSVRHYHLPYIRSREYIRVKSIYRLEEEINPEREALYPGIRFTSKLEDILEDGEVQLVVINTPDQWHVSYAVQALEQGKHILVEKPFAPTAKEAEEVFALARRKGLLAYVNQNRRYDADYLVMKEVVESDALGELVEVESHYDYFHPKADKDADYLYGLGVHILDQMIALFGVPEHYRTHVRGVLEPAGGRDFFELQLFYGTVRVTVSSSEFVKLPNPRFAVHGTRGSFVKMSQGHLSGQVQKEPFSIDYSVEDASNWGTLSCVDDYGNDITCRIPSRVTDYGRVYDDIAAYLEHGKPLPIREEEVLAVLRILEEARKEADDRCQVK